MPYNTRRKSLSLPSLGIHVPMSQAARAAAAAALANRQSPSHSHHSAASTSTSSPSFSPRSPPSPAESMDAQALPPRANKIKRSHSGDRDSHADVSPPPAKRHQPNANTPPPSPRAYRAVSIEMRHVDDYHCAAPARQIDLSSINDDIVEAVVVQLQATGNRPHIVKELAAVLMQQLKIVQQSANPCAIISSRLSTYLKRSCWNANNPCPLAKELETIHPRRTYFYLTTCPHQPLPDPTMAALAALQSRAIVTPSASSDEEDADEERRRELSPSPEVDLSSPELDDMDDDVPMPGTPIGSFSGRHNSILSISVQSHRAASPPLEKDEKEFTQTADGLQKRKLSGGLLAVKVDPVAEPTSMDVDDHHKVDGLFGDSANKAPAVPNHGTPSMAFLASPAMRPAYCLDLKKQTEADNWVKLDSLVDWERSPETVELDELDTMLNDI